MDQEDEQSGRMEEIHRNLQTAYCQLTLKRQDLGKSAHPSPPTLSEEEDSVEDPIAGKPASVQQSQWKPSSPPRFLSGALFILQASEMERS